MTEVRCGLVDLALGVGHPDDGFDGAQPRQLVATQLIERDLEGGGNVAGAFDGFERPVLALDDELPGRDVRQGEEVEIDGDLVAVAGLRDEPPGDPGPGGCGLDEDFHALVFKPAGRALRIRRRTRQVARLDEHAVGCDAPDLLEVVFDGLGPALGKGELALFDAGVGGAAHDIDLGGGVMAQAVADHVEDVEIAVQGAGQAGGLEGVGLGAVLEERIPVRDLAAAGEEEHHVRGRRTRGGGQDLEIQGVGLERDRVQKLVGQHVAAQDGALEGLEDGNELGGGPGLPDPAAMRAGQTGEKLVGLLPGHVIDAIDTQFRDAAGLDRHLGDAVLAVQVLAVREHHHQLLLVVRHAFRDVEAGQDRLVEIGLGGDAAVEGVGEEGLQLGKRVGPEGPDVERAASGGPGLGVAEHHGVDGVDRPYVLQKFVEGGEQGLDGLALIHGEGIVDHQHQVHRQGLGARHGFGRQDAGLADALAQDEVLRLEAQDGVARRVEDRGDDLAREVRGLHRNLRRQARGQQFDIRSGAGAGGEHQADQHDVEPREQWFLHVHSPSGYRASAQQCQAQPGKIGDQGEDRQQKADEGQAGRVELEHRPLEAQTGDEEVDAQRRE